MLGASVVFLDQLLKLSVTGDTAKYLVSTLERVCTFTTRLKQPFYPLPSCSEKERRSLRRDLWGKVKAELLYHVVALEASSLGENFGPFVPGWQSSSELFGKNPHIP